MAQPRTFLELAVVQKIRVLVMEVRNPIVTLKVLQKSCAEMREPVGHSVQHSINQAFMAVWKYGSHS